MAKFLLFFLLHFFSPRKCFFFCSKLMEAFSWFLKVFQNPLWRHEDLQHRLLDQISILSLLCSLDDGDQRETGCWTDLVCVCQYGWSWIINNSSGETERWFPEGFTPDPINDGWQGSSSISRVAERRMLSNLPENWAAQCFVFLVELQSIKSFHVFF